jgi:putative Ca2+/H+ antiporter (TMEM165/GDT1 family)
LSDVSEQKDTTTFVDGLLKSKYSDLIILSTVILAFLIMIIISATLT